MKKPLLLISLFILILLTCIPLTGCSGSKSSKSPQEPSSKSFMDELDTYNETTWKCSDDYSNGSVFDCTWRKDNIAFEDGQLTLSLLEEPSSLTPRYSGGEYRTIETFGHGLYTVRMKPAKNIGIVSSFFTYIGPSEDEPWDEIDIEFLGKDTTKVQFNYYTDGKKPSGETLYDLGFDAAEDFHEYGFLWEPDSITWYVDGRAVHTADVDIPTTPGHIMINLWPGTGVDHWLGKYDGKTPISATYDWIQYTPLKSN